MRILRFWGEFRWGFKRLGEDGECHRQSDSASGGIKGIFGMEMLCEDDAESLLRCSTVSTTVCWNLDEF